GLPVGLCAVVEKMMRKSPDERYPAPRDVAESLEPFTDIPAGTLYASPGSSGIRGGGRSAATETQVVDAPRMTTAAPVPPPTQVATQLAIEIPHSPASSAMSSGSGPPVAIRPGTPASSTSTSGSNANRDELGLGIDLGPEPSLTEGLQSGKKRSKPSSSGSAT